MFLRQCGIGKRGGSYGVRLLFCLAACLPGGIPGYAISPKDNLSRLTIRHWGLADGLPEETFAAILAPGDGYVWLAANHGLVRFDGQRGQVFRVGDVFRPRGTGSCSSNNMTSLLMDSRGTIWAGSSSGCLFRVMPDRFGTFANFRLEAIDSPTSDRETTSASTLRNLPDGSAIEIGRRSRTSILSLNLGSLKPPPDSNRSAEQVLLNAPKGGRIPLTARDSRGRLWAIESDSAIYMAERNSPGDRWSWKKQFEWSFGSRSTPQRMIVDQKDNVWIGHSEGLAQWRDGSFRNWQSADGLPPGQVSALLEDRAGCLWAGYPAAIARICEGLAESIALGEEQEEILSTLAEDPYGNIWAAGRWGNLYRISTPIFHAYTRRQKLPESHFMGVTVDSSGDVWGALRDSGIIRLSGGVLAQTIRTREVREMQTLLPHPDSGILAAGISGIFHVNQQGAGPIHLDSPVKFHTQAALAWQRAGHLLYSNQAGNYRLRRTISRSKESWAVQSLQGPNRIRQWANGPDGRTWAIAQYRGLHLLNGESYVPAPNSQPAKARAWYSIVVDHSGLLWIGTTDGLEIYSPAEERFLTAGPLVAGEHIFHVVHDGFGKVWCATRAGLVRFARTQALDAISGSAAAFTSLAVEHFGEAQDLPTTNFGLVTSATGATGPDGRIWFPGLLGLVAVQPQDFERQPRSPVPVLHELNIDGLPQDLNREVQVAPGANALEFLFQTIRRDPLGGDFCRLQMAGFDEDWRPCNGQRTAQYTNLRPGNYEFIVQSSSQADVWNGQELRVPVAVRPAVYERVSVQVGFAVLIVSAVIFAVWRREKVLVDQNRLLELKVEERTVKLETAMHAAESASRAKTEFLATMSHEIRTPMNGVLGALQVLSDSPLDGEQRKLISVIQQSGEDLVGIVDDILSLAKVEAGKLTLEKAPVDLRGMGENLISLFRPKAEAKGVAIGLSVAPGVPGTIWSDPQRLRQILLNLLGNAVKFTAAGEVRLRISVETEAVVFEVKDTGLGIAVEHLPTLFDPFVQADSSTTRRFGGSGLGLSIVRRFVDALGGTVGVTSEFGRGSNFRVQLPLEIHSVPAVDDMAPPIDRLPPRTGEGLTVLLAEDNPVNQLVFQKMLARLGCQVLVASHGREALRLLRSEAVDLVLMDCQMPEMDGYEATRELRAWGGEFENLPVIALTASALDEDRQRCFAAGMNEFLSKPLLLPRLKEAITRWNPAGKTNEPGH